jgi:hypothetical protein
MKLAKKNLSNKARSKRSERQAAKSLGGKLQPASGALNAVHLKGDVKTDIFLVDDKVTAQKSFSLNFETWRKLSKEAWVNDRKPLFRVQTPKETVYILDEVTFFDMIKTYEP